MTQALQHSNEENNQQQESQSEDAEYIQWVVSVEAERGEGE